MQAKLIIFGIVLTIGAFLPIYKPIALNKIVCQHLRIMVGSAGTIFLVCALIKPLQNHFTFIMLVWLLCVSSDIYYLERKAKIDQRKSEKVRSKHDKKRNHEKKSTNLDS
ncbi:MAG: hypothetical protein MR210_03895 [Erysipelotrichaceae bacterium]|nr:hypothetical protein [Erysipelotrichaceae bacterium]MDY5251250.1 hypothetical protein [Erysipelotrichaceae bacterium]